MKISERIGKQKVECGLVEQPDCKETLTMKISQREAFLIHRGLRELAKQKCWAGDQRSHLNGMIVTLSAHAQHSLDVKNRERDLK